ncbi:MAG: hypothetical protein OXQ90_03855 [Gammaproteobacteria bacterium]|nr:hypothetical protein [Gammaproteobacteria bacterium]
MVEWIATGGTVMSAVVSTAIWVAGVRRRRKQRALASKVARVAVAAVPLAVLLCYLAKR